MTRRDPGNLSKLRARLLNLAEAHLGDLREALAQNGAEE